MIEIDGLTKRYGDKTAVDRLSFVVELGVVTGHRVRSRDGDVLNVLGATPEEVGEIPATSSWPCSAWPPERAPSKKRSSTLTGVQS